MTEWPPPTPYSPMYEQRRIRPVYAIGQSSPVAYVNEGPTLMIPTPYGTPYLYDRQLTDVDLMRIWMDIDI